MKYRPQSDFSEELQAHLALEIDRLRDEGLSEEEAYSQARRNLGNLAIAGERFYEARRWLWFDHLLQDTRLTFRRMRKAPAFTITVMLTLALGIGATTSIFTIVYAVLFRSLAVANPDDLYRLGKQAHCCNWTGYSQDREFSMISYDMYKYFRDHTQGFAELAAFEAFESQFGVRRAGDSEPAQSYTGEFVSGNYFAMFGLHAYAGRMLTNRDDRPGALPTVVMSYRLWQQRYGSDLSVIGSVFNLDAKPFVLVGVAPPGFFGDRLRNDPPDFYLPLNTEPAMETNANLNRPDTHWLDVIGRIAPGENPISLESRLRVALKQWLRSHWNEMSANDRAVFAEQTLFLKPGGSGITSMREDYEHWLQILMMVSGCVLLIVCANVANLMLVRGMERRQEISLSMALGAQAPRLVRQALTESILFSLLGGAAGLAIAFAGTVLILHFAFPTESGMASIPIDASPSGPVLLFAFAVSVFTGIVFGVAPASMAARTDPMDALRGAGRSIGRADIRRTGWLSKKGLVVFQAALSLVLLSASGLLTGALYHLQTQELGVDEGRRIVASTNPRLAGYRPDQLTPLYQRIHDSLAGIPGVSAVALCSHAPLTVDAWGANIQIDGRPVPGPRDDNFAMLERVTAGYFDAIGTPIIRGRGINEQDTAASLHVAVVNRTFARKFFPHQDPIGKHFGRWIGGGGQYQIIGVAQDAYYLTLDLGKPITATIFLPESQHDYRLGAGPTEVSPGTHFLDDIIVVTASHVTLPGDQIRKALASVNPDLPITSIQTLSERVEGQFSQPRLMARLTSLFGILSLVLASIGLYGITAYNVGRRTNELGVRMVLGANRGQVIRLVLMDASLVIALGLSLGVPLSLGAGSLLSSVLYGVSPYNLPIIAAAVVTLAISAFVAAVVPAIRAGSIAPMSAIRAE